MIFPSQRTPQTQLRATTGFRAKAARRVAQPPSYFLEVAIRIQPGQMEEFSLQAKSVLPAAQNDTGLRLVAAGFLRDPDPRDVIHLWGLESADQLRAAMISLSDVPAYGVLDAMVVEENQQICTPLIEVPKKGRGNLYVRVTGVVRTSNLAEFVAQLEASSADFTRTSQWQLAGALVNVTGRVNRVSLIWAVSSQESAMAFITQLPGYDLMDDSASEIWTPTTYDP
jgi:hypothetical protein